MITKKTLLLMSALVSAMTAFSIDIPGGNVSGIWTLEESPVIVQGNIRIADGESLQIDPGVEVRFAGAYYLRVVGSLNATGNVADSVQFTSAFENTYWSGIKVDSLSLNSDTARFEYCSIRQMQYTGIQIINTSKVVFSDCLIEHSDQMYTSALYCAQGSPRIHQTTFRENHAGSGSEGGAMYIWDASPRLSNCLFENNTSPWAAGAVTVWRDDETTAPEFLQCVFRGNSTNYSGGAVVLHSNTPALFEHCVFEENTAGTNGGAIWSGYTQVSPITMSSCRFNGNLADDNGGALYLVETKMDLEYCLFEQNQTTSLSGGAIYATEENLILNFYRCHFYGNTANSSGGGLHVLDYATVHIDRCSFMGNSANLGGGLSIDAYTDPMIRNTVFANNTAAAVGGGVYSRLHSHPTYTHCTFANNESLGQGGAMMLYWESDPVLTNCVFWGNISEDGVSTYAVNDYIWNYCDPSFYHCVVEGGISSMLPGTSSILAYEGCVEEDPLFVGPTAIVGSAIDDYTALWAHGENSPCMDAGLGTLESLELADEDYFGNARLQGSALDIGAYEGFYPLFDAAADVNDDGSVGTDDLLLILSGYGCLGPGCDADLNGDGNTGASDILIFLSSYTG